MLKLVKATAADAERLTAISKASFDDDSARFMDDKTPGPPGYADKNVTEYMIANCDTYMVLADDRLIGGAIVYTEEGKWIIGRIFLSPDEQRKGYGIALMNAVEAMYRDKQTLYLDTPKMNKRTNAFYSGLGYEIYKEDSFLNYYKKDVK